MNYKDVLDYFKGDRKAIAEIAEISVHGVRKWGEAGFVPFHQQKKLELYSKGALKADLYDMQKQKVYDERLEKLGAEKRKAAEDLQLAGLAELAAQGESKMKKQDDIVVSMGAFHVIGDSPNNLFVYMFALSLKSKNIDHIFREFPYSQVDMTEEHLEEALDDLWECDLLEKTVNYTMV